MNPSALCLLMSVFLNLNGCGALMENTKDVAPDETVPTVSILPVGHRCAMLEFEGKSYRLKEAAARFSSPEIQA